MDIENNKKVIEEEDDDWNPDPHAPSILKKHLIDITGNQSSRLPYR